MGDVPPFFCFLCVLLVLCIVFDIKCVFLLNKWRISAVFFVEGGAFVAKKMCWMTVGAILWWCVRQSVGVGGCA